MLAVDTYATIVIRVDEATLKGLRQTMSTQNAAADLAEVTRLNGVYIEAAKTASASMFEGILADDFLCTLPDGALLDRAQFLKRTLSSSPLADLRAQDVNVRLLGDVAIVHAATTFRHPDGTAGSGRYTDIWARRHGRWVAVAAQFTRK